MLTKLVCASVLLFFTLFLSPSATSASNTIQYDQRCESIVPASIPTEFFKDSDAFQWNGYFTGGEALLRPVAHSKSFTSPPPSGTFNFYSQNIHQTRDADVLLFDGSLSLSFVDGDEYASPRNYSRFFNRGGTFQLSGFWSRSNGRLCLVGNGYFRALDSRGRGRRRFLPAVVNLKFPTSSNISASFVTGTVEIFDADDSQKKFDPISLLAYDSMGNYTYTKIDEVKESCSELKTDEEYYRKEEPVQTTCGGLQDYLVNNRYGPRQGRNFSSLGFAAESMSFRDVQCSQDGNLHTMIVFTNGSWIDDRSMVTERSLAAEGFWDHQNNRLCLVACHVHWQIPERSSSSSADCSISLSLWFPASVSMFHRSFVVGEIRSSIDKVSFHSRQDEMVYRMPGVKYSYTLLDAARNSCSSSINGGGLSHKRFPDPRNPSDMQFYLQLKDAEGKRYEGYASPMSLNENYLRTGHAEVITAEPPMAAAETTSLEEEINTSVWNISYNIFFYSASNSTVGAVSSYAANLNTELLAEGTYNSATGRLCMAGCRVNTSRLSAGEVESSDFKDCHVTVDIQLSPLDPGFGGHLSGSIKSSRAEKHPLHFKSLQISSQVMYVEQAKESIKRVDKEVVMLLVSLSFSCVCIVMQLFHVKKHPDTFPSISIMMLVILTLGHMIPLLLNFEALFMKSRNNDNVLLSAGGWLEAKEVNVRTLMMVAFLLQFSLLQSSLSSRLKEEGKGLWVAEKDTLAFCLPLYLAGALMTWFIKLRSDTTRSQWQDLILQQQHSLWKGLMNYSGLILDGFLLPQIILNVFSKSKDKILNPFFYAGTTAIRAFPHLYDVYRMRHYVKFSSSQIYAGPDGDFYSLAWDIIIPAGCLLFAAIIFLQQRCGGAAIIPARFRNFTNYQVVSTVGL